MHLSSNEKYGTILARLRMNILRSHGVESVDFELWCPAASAINGCGDRAVWLLSGNATSGWSQLVCMNPGGERPNPGSFGGIEVLNTGTRC